MNDRPNHLQVPKFFCTNVCQESFQFLEWYNVKQNQLAKFANVWTFLILKALFFQ